MRFTETMRVKGRGFAGKGQCACPHPALPSGQAHSLLCGAVLLTGVLMGRSAERKQRCAGSGAQHGDAEIQPIPRSSLQRAGSLAGGGASCSVSRSA